MDWIKTAARPKPLQDYHLLTTSMLGVPRHGAHAIKMKRKSTACMICICAWGSWHATFDLFSSHHNVFLKSPGR